MTTETLMPAGLGGELVLAARDYKRDRGLWLKARRSGLGASDTAAVLGLGAPYTTALDVWEEKTSTVPPDDSDTSEAAEWGNVLETPVARQTVKKHPELGKLVPTPGLLRHPAHPWMLATIDFGLAPRGKRYAPVRELLEVKTTSEQNYRLNWVDGVPPAKIQVQCQQQLAVTGLEVAWVTCLVGGQKLAEPYRVERSEAVIEQLVNYAGTWWADFVETGRRPDPTFADLDKLARLYPQDLAADAVRADDKLEAAVARLVDAKRRAKEAEADEEQAKFTIQTAMKERTAVVNTDGEGLVTWKEQTQRKWDGKALEKDHPELVEKYKTPRVSRVLRVVNKKEN